MKKRIKDRTWYKVSNKILKLISWAVLIVLIAIAACLIFYVISSKKAEKSNGTYKPPFSLYTIISPSMVPTLNVYDVIVNLTVTDPSTLKKGDIITFASSNPYLNGMIITHRIVEVYNTEDGIQFRTKGDSNQTPDSSLVLGSNVIGKTSFKIPQLGRVQFFLADKGGWFIVILLPALIVISYDIYKLFKLIILKSKIEKIDRLKQQ